MSERELESESIGQSSSNLCVVGLGYVGLPLAYEFDKEGHNVFGFDIDSEKIETLERGNDPTGDIGDASIKEANIEFTTNPEVIADVEYVLVSVPTPVDSFDKPDLSLVKSAGRTIGEYVEPGSTVILESTVYPGATREVFAPAIEKTSGLNAGDSLGIGYSPERMVPGDEKHGLQNVVKIVSALTEDTLVDVASLYETVVDAGVHRAPSTETAEAAKCVENIQRDLNIALVNELAVACNHLNLDTEAVLEAAGTKWNFHDYRPGLVGGHCIPVDPFFFIYESKKNGFTPELVEKAREVNEYMPKHTGNLMLKGLNRNENVLSQSRVLICGLSYKSNVADVRTSAVNGTIEKLQEYGVDVVGYDPLVNDEIIGDEFGIQVQSQRIFENFDGLLFGAAHDAFDDFNFDRIRQEMNNAPVVVDATGHFQSQVVEAEIDYRGL